ALGVIRTQELLAARRIDGGEQFFTRANDFGYSRSPDETLAIWNKDSVLADVVRVIRQFRPDVIITRFPTTGEGGHGHHTASALLAVEALEVAADAARFPHLNLPAWRVKRVFWNAWAPKDSAAALQVDLGTYNPVLGQAYGEIAAESRSQHKSQGFGAPKVYGSRNNYLELIAGEPVQGEPPHADLFEGVDLTWGRVPGGGAAGKLAARALRDFDAEHPERIVPTLVAAHRALQKVEDPYWRAWKSEQLQKLIADCAGLYLAAEAESPYATPGDSVRTTVKVVSRLGLPVTLHRLRWTAPDGVDLDTTMQLPLPPNEALTFGRTFVLPDAMRPTQPYWLRQPPPPGLYVVADPTLIGRPTSPPALSVQLDVEIAGERLTYARPLRYRRVDPVRGELYRDFEIRPPVTVDLTESVLTFLNGATKTVGVRLRNGQRPAAGSVRLELPAGWRATPAHHAFDFEKPETEQTFTFEVRPAAGDVNQTRLLRAQADVGGATYCRGLLTVDYEHISPQTLFPPAAARVVNLDMQIGGGRIGYVPGAGDLIPEALRQVGYEVFELNAAELAAADLSRYDAVVTGVRAFNVNHDLVRHRERLLDYVRAGGTWVAQYNTSYRLLTEEIGPYPFKIGRRERVTVEEAPVTFLDADHPLLRAPNALSDADFDGWVQERGLYFAESWDERYDTLLRANDPGLEPMAGGLLYGRLGRGAFIYTGYSFFRQLPAGVPGAFRLFANLLTGGVEPRPRREPTPSAGE
ncbi:MAG: PIG-L family deacetylase, partial [Catalinimonas sp.]